MWQNCLLIDYFCFGQDGSIIDKQIRTQIRCVHKLKTFILCIDMTFMHLNDKILIRVYIFSRHYFQYSI